MCPVHADWKGFSQKSQLVLLITFWIRIIHSNWKVLELACNIFYFIFNFLIQVPIFSKLIARNQTVLFIVFNCKCCFLTPELYIVEMMKETYLKNTGHCFTRKFSVDYYDILYANVAPSRTCIWLRIDTCHFVCSWSKS